MNRRKFLYNSSITLGAYAFFQQSLLSCTSAAKTPTWKITMLRNNIGLFEENGGTVAFLLSPEGTVVVDAQYQKEGKHLADEMKKRNTKPVKLLINTHHHKDHTGGNIAFKGVAEHVLAHANSKKNQMNWARDLQMENVQLYPDQVFTDNWCGQFGDEKICIDYFGPAHTDGDSIIHFQHANIIHAGDLVFNRHQPNVDKTAGANIKNWMTVLDKMIAKYDRQTLYVYGHSDNGFKITGNVDDLQKFRDFLGNLLKYVESQIRAGKSKEEILMTKLIPGGEEWGGDRIELGLEGAYTELTKG